MALKTTVKVSGVNNLSDARYCAGMGVALIGFDLTPGSPNFLLPEKAREIAGWLAGASIVGEITGPAVPAWADYPLAALQVDNETALGAVQTSGLPVWYAIEVTLAADLALAESTMQQLSDQVTGFLLHGSIELAGSVHQTLASLASRFPILLGIGIGDNVLELLESIRPLGLALQGGQESRPGWKDFDEMAAVLDRLEVEDGVEY